MTLVVTVSLLLWSSVVLVICAVKEPINYLFSQDLQPYVAGRHIPNYSLCLFCADPNHKPHHWVEDTSSSWKITVKKIQSRPVFLKIQVENQSVTSSLQKTPDIHIFLLHC